MRDEWLPPGSLPGLAATGGAPSASLSTAARGGQPDGTWSMAAQGAARVPYNFALMLGLRLMGRKKDAAATARSRPSRSRPRCRRLIASASSSRSAASSRTSSSSTSSDAFDLHIHVLRRRHRLLRALILHHVAAGAARTRLFDRLFGAAFRADRRRLRQIVEPRAACDANALGAEFRLGHVRVGPS